jgi:20S proteasome subunit alpha 2
LLNKLKKNIIFVLFIFSFFVFHLCKFLELKAGAIGKNRAKATQNLEKRYKDGLSLDDGLSIVISTMREGYDGELNENNIELAILKSTGFELLTPEQIKNYLRD